MTYWNTNCQVTGKPVRLYAECPLPHLRQVARYAATGFDAVAIAEDRYQKAQKLRVMRARMRKAKREAEIADDCEMDL